MSFFDLCPLGTKVCDNVCIQLDQICCPADSPELDNAGGCDADQYCVFDGCCELGKICPGAGPSSDSIFDDEIESILDEIFPETETDTGFGAEETTDIFESSDDDDFFLTEEEDEDSLFTEDEDDDSFLTEDEEDDILAEEDEEDEETVTEGVAVEETSTPVTPAGVGGDSDDADDDDDDDDDDEVGGGGSSGSGGGSGGGGGGGGNVRPGTPSVPSNPVSTDAAVSDFRPAGFTKKAVLGLGLFALLAL